MSCVGEGNTEPAIVADRLLTPPSRSRPSTDIVGALYLLIAVLMHLGIALAQAQFAMTTTNASVAVCQRQGFATKHMPGENV